MRFGAPQKNVVGTSASTRRIALFVCAALVRLIPIGINARKANEILAKGTNSFEIRFSKRAQLSGVKATICRIQPVDEKHER